MLSRPKQETVTLESLDLLKKTADYLKRLPMVPVTHALIREIDAHLADPGVAAARREAEAAELLASKRVAQSWSAAGQLLYQAVVEGERVTIKVPPRLDIPGHTDKRMDLLKDGITMRLQPTHDP